MTIRTIEPAEFMNLADTVMVLDVRRREDRDTSQETVAGATWQDPTHMDTWIGAVPYDQPIVIYCARGGSVSNSVVDRLRAAGVQARFIVGGIEGLKAAGGPVVAK